MKKKVNLPIFFLGFCIFSCSSNKYSIDLITPFYNDDLKQTITIYNYEVERLISSKSDFILFVGNEACSSCAKALKTLNTFIQEKHLLIYRIDLNGDINSYEYISSSYNMPAVNPSTLLFFNNGSISALEPYSSSIYYSSINLHNLFKNYVNSSGITLLNDISKDKILSTSKKIKTPTLYGSRYDINIIPYMEEIENDLQNNQYYYLEDINYLSDNYQSYINKYSLDFSLPSIKKS